MRIIRGRYQRRQIVAPNNLPVRPTTDMAKENLFNILENYYDFEETEAMDLFAGTGQLGIEALSRGAAECVFVDQRADAAALVRQNVELCGLGDRQLDRLLAAMRRADVSVPYKAVLTEHNKNWTFADLVTEVAREHEAMRAARKADTVQ